MDGKRTKLARKTYESQNNSVENTSVLFWRRSCSTPVGG